VVRRAVIGGFLALVLAAPAAAQRTQLMPGVTYERGVQFTPHGPVSLHVVTAPQPTGLYALEPVLSNDTVEGRETVTSMQRRIATTATSVGVNADLFTWANGRPSGVYMRDRVLAAPPHGGRSSIGIRDDGTLDVRRVEFFATWRGFGQRRTLNGFNQPPGPNGIALYTPTWGRAVPAQPGAVTAVLADVPAATPNTDLQGQVVEIRNGSATTIPAGGAVLVARGTAGQRLRDEAPVGSWVTLRLIFRPAWSEVASAVGGGPVIVRDGKTVFRSFEAFGAEHLLPRNPRTAVGQLADGRILLVVTDGRQPGYSVGMTNFELAQTMTRLGAVRASALDAGGSSTLAFDGQLLNHPSDRAGERPIASSLQLQYFGAFVAPPQQAVLSPNGDGVAEQQALSYKLVRPSLVNVTLTGPDGAVAFGEQQVQRAPGRYTVAFPPAPTPEVPEPAAPAEGTWRLKVEAVDEEGQASDSSQTFAVNNTLAALRLTPGRLVVRAGGSKRLRAGVTLARGATVAVTVETRAGVPVATLLRKRVEPGRLLFSWTGRTAGGRRLAYGGSYLVRVRAKNELGTVELTRNFGVLRAAPLKAAKKRG
jgi:hypothetical protein